MLIFLIGIGIIGIMFMSHRFNGKRQRQAPVSRCLSP